MEVGRTVSLSVGIEVGSSVGALTGTAVDGTVGVFVAVIDGKTLGINIILGITEETFEDGCKL